MIEKILSRAAKIKRTRADIIAGAVISAVSLFLLAYGIPYGISIGRAGISKGANNPLTMPYAISIAFLIMGTIVLIRGINNLILEKKRNQNEQENPEASEISFLLIASLLAVIGILFALLFRRVGFVPLNIVAMILVYYLFSGNKWYEALILSVVFTAIAVLFFKYYLLINIPLGLGIG